MAPWLIMRLTAFTFPLALLAASCCPQPKADSCCHAQSKPDPIMHVVMVHGFLERGSNFKMLRERLEKKQVACHVVRLKPSDGRKGICNQAESLRTQIEESWEPARNSP